MSDRLRSFRGETMLVTVVLVGLAVCACAFVASVLITRASNRSAAWNMALGALLALAVLGGVAVAGWLLARAAFPG